MTANHTPAPAAAAAAAAAAAQQKPVAAAAGLPIHLEVDIDDADSSLGDDGFTITTSLASSVRDYRHENGRRYHSFDEDAYYLPNDDIEAARLDLQHYTWKVTFGGGLGRVPITENIKTVLDVGTGTGVWAIEFAEEHPNIQVIGTDLSPIQPDVVPPNCRFLIDNAELPWAFETKFDYIHTRMLIMGIHDWAKLFKQCWENLEPGGWLDTHEIQLPLRRVETQGKDSKPSKFIQWGEYLSEALAHADIDTTAHVHFSDLLKAQGFINVDRVDLQWPIKSWAKGRKNKLIGRLLYENTQQAISASSMALFTRHLGWTREQVDAYVTEALAELDRPDSHYYYVMTLHRAQKPLTASASASTPTPSSSTTTTTN